MSTTQIGQSLVRKLGNGKNMYTVTTETLGKGVTLTKIVDSNGNQTTRLKQIYEKVPFNDVYTRNVRKSTNYNDKAIKSASATRVYDVNGNYIGTNDSLGWYSGSISPKDYFQKMINRLRNPK